MTTRGWFAAAFGAAVLCTIASTGAGAADWQPLAIGSQWVYEGELGAHQVQTIVGERTVRGRVTASRSYAEGPDAGLENYWLLDADGSVLLAGFDRTDEPGVAYEPPIRYFPVPPALGAQPVQHITAYRLETGAVFATFDIRIDVVEDVVLTVPAGTFHAFGVAEVISSPAPLGAGARALALDGRRVGTASPSAGPGGATDWYAEGVGEVQYLGQGLMQLVSSNLPTPVALTSWARVKRLYR